MSGGRPTKLTKALVAKLQTIADDGLALNEACRKLGISTEAWRRWENNGRDDELHTLFRGLAARVRAGMGSATDDMAWGVLREVAEDPLARPSDRLAAAQAILRLRSTHKVELSGGIDIVTLAKLAKNDAG